MHVLAEATTTALHDLRRYALRYSLVALSLLIGVASISGITTMSYLSREDLVAKSEQLTGRAPTYSVFGSAPHGTADWPLVRQRLDASASASLALSAEVLGAVEAVPATGWYPNSALPSPSTDPGIAVERYNLNAMWFAGHPEAVRRIVTIDGAWPMNGTTPALVANVAAAAAMGAAGEQVLLSPTGGSRVRRFAIAAVVDDGVADPLIYLSLDQPAARDLQDDTEQGVTLRVHSSTVDEAMLPSALDDLAGDLGLAHDQPPYRSDSVREIEDAVERTEGRFIVAGFLALVIASLGILNIGLATVNERWRELAVRAAFGATALRLFLPVVLSSVFIAGAVWTTTAAGVVVAVRHVGSTIPLGSPLTAPPIPAAPLALSLIAGTLTAVFGAAVPAWRAARSEPADALRS